MLYIYRSAASEGAEALQDALNDAGIPARYTRGRLLRDRFRPERDRLIAWGSFAQDKVGLNNQPTRTKYEDALALREAGVPTVEVSPTRPAAQERGLFWIPLRAGQSGWTEAEVRELIPQMQAYLDAPIPQIEWLPRRNNHVGGSDLLARPANPDYWSKKEDLVEEYRLHVFGGKSIRAGVKVPREGVQQHEWVRSFDAGWRIQYDGFSSTQEMKDLAKRAVAALGLHFGAVDLAKTRAGQLLVLEVNRAPGIEGGSVEAYVKAIQGWLRG